MCSKALFRKLYFGWFFFFYLLFFYFCFTLTICRGRFSGAWSVAMETICMQRLYSQWGVTGHSCIAYCLILTLYVCRPRQRLSTPRPLSRLWTPSPRFVAPIFQVKRSRIHLYYVILFSLTFTTCLSVEIQNTEFWEHLVTISHAIILKSTKSCTFQFLSTTFCLIYWIRYCNQVWMIVCLP